MAQLRMLAENEASAKAMEIYEEIKKTLGIPIVPNLFKAMGTHPDYLQATWNQFKSVMGSGELTRREKEAHGGGRAFQQFQQVCRWAPGGARLGRSRLIPMGRAK